MDVVLVGLPGSGKSAVGRRLAHRHDARFVDLDESIEKAAGKSIEDIERAMDRDKFMSAEEAREFGLVDEVFEKRPVPSEGETAQAA